MRIDPIRRGVRVGEFPGFRSFSGHDLGRLEFTYKSTSTKDAIGSNTMLPSNYLTASQVHDLVESGDLTLEQIIGDHQTRIEERDQDVLAWKCTNFDAPPPALTKELCGITIGVKDIMSKSTLNDEC